MTNLPENWTICYLSEIASRVRGVSYDKSDLGIEDSTHTCLLRANNIQDGNIIYDDVQYVSSSVIDALQNMKKFDILIAMSSGSKNLVGKTAQYLHNERNITFGAFCSVVRPDKNINPIFLGKFFQTNTYRKTVSGISKGVNINNLKNSHINNLSIPLPPLAEQGRIVQKIEELFADIDAGIQNLKSVQDQIKLYRQSVLKSAFEGKLYKTTEWSFEQIGKICEINPKTTIPALNDNSPVSFLPMPAVMPEINRFIPQIVPYSKVKKGYTKFANSDVLFAKITPCMENGKSCVVHDLLNGIGFGSTEFHVLRPKEKITPLFVFYFIVQPIFRTTAIPFMTGAVGQKRIPADYLRDYIIPVPTLDEQERIVAEIERRFEQADELEKAVNAALADAEKMKQAILKKAFRGELVEQNPDDEPAAVLLDRIRAERAAAPKSPKKEKENE